MSNKRTLAAAAAALAATGALVRWQMARWFTEGIPYQREKADGALEIRRYPRTVEAITAVEAGTWRRGVQRGFERLLRYRVGHSQPRQGIALSGDLDGVETVAMTTPVTARASGPGRWSVSFTMPADRSLAALPHPVDPRVQLRERPARRVAVWRFSGRANAERIERELLRAQNALQKQGIDTDDSGSFAGYDPPWTVPFLRRNEIWLELDSSDLH